MYKPNFCAECGARVERARWHVWTSRRFCRICARRFRRSRILSTLLVGATLFGLGLISGRFQRAAPPPLIVERASEPTPPVTLPPTASKEAAKSPDAANVTDATTDAASPTQSETAYGPDGTATERPTDPNEIVSICGARTQKGTPCRRRVRGTGRCWQHKGLPAMLAPDKLIVRE